MSNEVQIYLNEHSYTPGQTVAGRVECNYSSNQDIKGLTVKFSGKCTTSWTETESYYDSHSKKHRTRHVHYSGEEIYFKDEYSLVGSTTLPAGRQVYDFSYKLPDILPSSYNDHNNWGCVQYRVKAVVDRGWKFNSEAVAVFTVVSPLDLNYVPGIREPVNISLDKVLCSCCCRNNDVLTFKFSLPSTGYIPGQDVSIGACVENLTNTNVQSVKFKISENTEFVVNRPRTSFKYNKEVVAATVSGAVGAHGDKSWTTVLNIPRDRYFPNLVNCSLIRMTYELKAEVVLPMPHTNLSTVVPITIGHVQFVGAQLNLVLGPPQERLPNYDGILELGPPQETVPNYEGVLPSAPPPGTDQSPPSYSEAQMTQKC
ncbi:hypothetical protein FQR65_LT13333 [Abscondita terminalis]|nr:hypothetical protein FQR65_LT13333 [Abscondita terminalis]